MVCHYVSAGASDIGAVRQINEDSYLEHTAQGLWLVADGMGGHFAGDYASQFITQAFSQCQLDKADIASCLDTIDDLLTEVNTHLLDYAQSHGKKVVGSTLVLLLLRPEIGVCLWMGDSRLYRVKQGEMSCMTTDHSLVQLLMDRGELSIEDSIRHPAKHVITCAMGVEAPIKYEVCVFDPEVGDRYLLCSDGLYNAVNNEHLSQVLSQPLSVEYAVQQLLVDALAAGADDNVTLVGVAVCE